MYAADAISRQRFQDKNIGRMRVKIFCHTGAIQ